MKTLCFVLVGGVVVSLGAAAAAPADPLDQAFAATPAQLLAAAKAAPASDADVVVLRDETTIRYDDHGKAEHRWRMVAVVTKPSGVDDWGTLGESWSPFYQDKPVVRARVIAPDGQVAELDPALVHDAPAVTESPSVFSDRHLLEVPLPRLSVGAVIEEEVVTRDREPLLAAGVAATFGLARGVPIVRERFTIEAPTAHAPHVLVRGLPKAPAPRTRAHGGLTATIYDFGAIAALERHDVGVPADVAPVPYLGLSTGASWEAVATGYRALVDARLASTIALPDGLKAATARETIDRATAWLHANIRYTGIELSDSALIPFTPAETAKRGFGDCKDKATLLVALLRAAGVTADLALLSTGPGTDIDRALPGMGVFDHAIVRARVDGKDVWIDATEENLPAGQLPARDQGRLALVIAAGTRDLVATPVGAPADNLVRVVRTYRLAEHDSGAVTEVTQQHGVFWDDLRVWYRDTKPADRRKSVAGYVESAMHGTLVDARGNTPTAVGQPFELTVEADHVKRAFTDRTHIDVYLSPYATTANLPSTFTDDDASYDAAVKDRSIDYAWYTPHVDEVENRLVLPPGYTAPTLVAREEKALGTMTLTTTRRLDHDALVITYRLDTGKRRISAAELAAGRAAVIALGKADLEHVVIAQTGMALAHQGKIKEAIAELQRLVALHPKEALHYDQIATAYELAGMAAAARRTALEATRVEPTSGDAFMMLGAFLADDTLGRARGFDMDRPGAIAALRKALTLSPTHLGALHQLATLLGIDDHDWTTSTTRDLVEAADLMRRAHDQDDDRATAYAEALIAAGKYAEAETFVRTLPDSDDNRGIHVFAVAAQRGSKEALALAASMGSGAQLTRLLYTLFPRALRARRYDLLRDVATALRDAGERSPYFDLADRLAPVDVHAFGVADPRRPVTLALLDMMGLPTGEAPWTPEIGEILDEGARQLGHNVAMSQLRLAPRPVAIDTMMASTKLEVQPMDGGGWRVLEDADSHHAVVYVQLDHGRATLVGGTDLPFGVAHLVLDRLGRNDVAGAARWMKRLSDDSPATTDLNPVVRDALALYRDEVARAGGKPVAKDVLELAAALMVGPRLAATAVPILRRCAVTGDAVHDTCRGHLGPALVELRRWDEAAAVAHELAARPDRHDGDVAAQEVFALTRAGKLADAQAAATEALRKLPDDPALLQAQAMTFVAAGDWSAASKIFDTLVASPNATAMSLNNAAWDHLLFDPDPSIAHALAARAEKMSGQALSDQLANTLAAIEAESDHPYQAWVYLQRALAADPQRAPADADWYVLGRIAESYGLRDDAIAAYRRVAAPKLPTPDSAYVLAQRNLKRMGAGAAAAAKP